CPRYRRDSLADASGVYCWKKARATPSASARVAYRARLDRRRGNEAHTAGWRSAFGDRNAGAQMTISHVQTGSPVVRIRLVRPLVSAVLCALVLALLAAYAPTFFKLNNLINILVQASTLAVMAIGMT